jgi:hypothetical protein
MEAEFWEYINEVEQNVEELMMWWSLKYRPYFRLLMTLTSVEHNLINSLISINSAAK